MWKYITENLYNIISLIIAVVSLVISFISIFRAKSVEEAIKETKKQQKEKELKFLYLCRLYNQPSTAATADDAQSLILIAGEIHENDFLRNNYLNELSNIYSYIRSLKNHVKADKDLTQSDSQNAYIELYTKIKAFLESLDS